MIKLLLSNKRSDRLIDVYVKYKEKCIFHMEGEFSFVIYDKNEKSYFAARDPIGVKPLYYTFAKNSVFFAYDIGQIIQKSGIKKEANLQTMQSAVYHSAIPYDETMYKNIKRVPPGHFMKVFANGEYTLERYWKPEEIKVDYKITEEEAEKKFLELFDQAVFDCIDDLNSTGFELSGGLDSSSIFSWVKHQKPAEKITAFSMNFKNMKKCNESEYVEAIQEKYNINLMNLDTENMDYRGKYSLYNNYKLNPYWPIFITYTMGFSVIEKARKLGIKTILTGQGGDHVMTGNPYGAYEYFKQFKWIDLYKDIKASSSPKSYIKRYILFPMIGEKNLIRLKSFRKKIKHNQDSNTNTVDISFEEFSNLYTGNSIAFKHDLIQVVHSTLSALMESSYYRVAESHYGIEFRHPFFDRRLVEFMLSLPPKFKFSEGVGKRLLRKTMQGILPDKIRKREDKAEFSEVLRQQIDVIDLNNLFENSYLSKLGLVEQVKIDTYREDYLSGEMKKIVYFWQLINLEYWYKYNFVNEDVMESEG